MSVSVSNLSRIVHAKLIYLRIKARHVSTTLRVPVKGRGGAFTKYMILGRLVTQIPRAKKLCPGMHGGMIKHPKPIRPFPYHKYVPVRRAHELHRYHA
jgi:hypothetical protein